MPVKKKTSPARKATTKSVKSLAKKTAQSNAKLKRAAAKLKKSNVSLEKTDAKLKRTDAKLKSDFSKLKTELSKLKKSPKAKKRELNEYNLFMRKQLRAGKNFKQAAVAWNRFKKLQNKREPSAYNSFIASQLKQGKTFKQSVALWKSLKSGRKPRARTIVKTKIKRVLVKAKPKLKYRTRVKRVIVKAKPKIKRIVVRQKPKIRYRTRTRIVEKPIAVEQPAEAKLLPAIAAEMKKVSKIPEHGLPLEELSYRLLTVYFQDLARHGLKRSVSLSELVDAYQFAWKRLEQKLGKPEKSLLHEEEIAFRLVKLYFFELARFGKKRTTTLEELLDAYFFVLQKIAA